MDQVVQPHWWFSTAGDVLFGRGAAQRIGQEARRRGFCRALIVCDPHIVQAGLLDRIRAPLVEADVACHAFDGGVPEPSAETVEAAVQAARQVTPDVIVGLGGGSNLDVAKVAAVVYAHGGSVADYFGEQRVPGPGLPMIAVPTTAGTGSEVTAVAVIEDVTRRLKLAVASPHLMPRLAVVDPLLTLTCPPRVTAESGVDALVHAVEAHTVVSHAALTPSNDVRPQFSGKQPIADLLAARAIRLIGRYLRLAVYQPRNLRAREGMHLAALLAGMAFNSAGLGAAHALQYPVGALTHTSHGLGTGLLLPYVVAHLLPANPRAFARVAGWLGERVTGMCVHEAAARCVEALQRLKREIGLPMRLREIGIQEAQLRPMAEQAATYQRLLRLSPRPLAVDDLEAILRCAY